MPKLSATINEDFLLSACQFEKENRWLFWRENLCFTRRILETFEILFISRLDEKAEIISLASPVNFFVNSFTLQVRQTSGGDEDRENKLEVSKKVFNFISWGTHWILITMIVCWKIVQQTSFNNLKKQGQLLIEVGIRIKNWITITMSLCICNWNKS